jgi:hypothetical protein
MNLRARLTREAEVRQEGWLRDGVIAGFIATIAMTVVLAAAYGLARAIGDEDGPTVLRWFWNLAHNPVTERPEDAPFIAIGLNLAVGLVLALGYAHFAEPILSGPAWQKGMLFSLLPWLISIVFFLPIMGGGFLGMDIEAGPLPILGNLVLHLVYGAVLGAVYGLRLEQGLADTPAERRNAARAERGAALGVAFGVVVGLVVGWLFSSAIDEVSTEALVATLGALVGGSIGMLIGSMVGMGDVFVAHE